MPEFLSPYRKTIAGLVAGLITWAITYNVLDEKWTALATVVAAATVYVVPNKTT